MSIRYGYTLSDFLLAEMRVIYGSNAPSGPPLGANIVQNQPSERFASSLLTYCLDIGMDDIAIMHVFQPLSHAERLYVFHNEYHQRR